MKAAGKCRRGALVSGALLCALFLTPRGAETMQGGDIAVVVRSDTPVSDPSLAEVRTMFRGERQYWSADVPMVLLIPAPGARERDVLLKIIYQMTEGQFNKYWIAVIFRSQAASPPKTIYSSEMANELVAAVPGAIALVDARNVRLGLKVLRVDGRLPGEPGYPLR